MSPLVGAAVLAVGMLIAIGCQMTCFLLMGIFGNKYDDACERLMSFSMAFMGGSFLLGALTAGIIFATNGFKP